MGGTQGSNRRPLELNHYPVEVAQVPATAVSGEVRGVEIIDFIASRLRAAAWGFTTPVPDFELASVQSPPMPLAHAF